MSIRIHTKKRKLVNTILENAQISKKKYDAIIKHIKNCNKYAPISIICSATLYNKYRITEYEMSESTKIYKIRNRKSVMSSAMQMIVPAENTSVLITSAMLNPNMEFDISKYSKHIDREDTSWKYNNIIAKDISSILYK